MNVGAAQSEYFKVEKTMIQSEAVLECCAISAGRCRSDQLRAPYRPRNSHSIELGAQSDQPNGQAGG